MEFGQEEPVMQKHDLEERIIGLLMGLGIGTVIGIFLRDSGSHPVPVEGRSRVIPIPERGRGSVGAL